MNSRGVDGCLEKPHEKYRVKGYLLHCVAKKPGMRLSLACLRTRTIIELNYE